MDGLGGFEPAIPGLEDLIYGMRNYRQDRFFIELLLSALRVKGKPLFS